MSTIEWTDTTWNPTRGCTRVSEGCRNCYAERMAARFSGPGEVFEGFARMGHYSKGPERGKAAPRWTGRVELIPSKLDDPLRWRKPRRVFVNSMSDLFHEALSLQDIARVVDVIAAAKQHTFQVLTKRPQRMLDFFAEIGGTEGLKPPSNLWLGVSVEDQATADERIPLLLQTPAAVRFVSYEPALGPVDLGRYGWLTGCDACCNGNRCPGPPECTRFDRRSCPVCKATARGTNLDWLIVGGESGPVARPFDVAWARSVVRQCREAGVACFVKQMGSNVRTRNDSLATSHPPDDPRDWPEPEFGWSFGVNVEENLDGFRDDYQGAPVRVRLTSRKGGDPAEWPEDLRVREFPA